MKGDFSRSSFDPRKHYRSVRMQQGRVQLDADWNEQQDILLHLITTQLRDLVGPGGTSATEAGFAITLVEQTGEPADENEAGLPDEHTRPGKRLPDFQIGAGRYYVDGVLCENEAPVLYSGQPDYPAAASLVQEPVDHDHFLVYLDVWQRHLTAWEDPTIREIALGGPDTTTRVKTVWQVKLLPLSGDPADDQGWRDHGALRSLADWQAFVEQATGKGRRLQARWEKEKGVILENHLYRVEIHTIADDQVTFKWSRENGSVVFPIVSGKCLFTWEDVPGNDNERLLTYLREGLALDWAEGESVQIDKLDDGLTIRIEKDRAWAEIVLNEEGKTATLTTSDGKRDDLKVRLKVRQEKGKHKLYTITNLSADSHSIKLNLEGLDRDPYQLQEGSWVELVDDVTLLNGHPLPLCQVAELDPPKALVTLHAEQNELDQIRAEIDARELHHPLLRRWEDDANPITPEPDTTAGQGETWLDLENGIQVAFSDAGTYQVGDYWLIPARTRSEYGIEWPQKDGQPLAQAPHGIAHHYAPLALLQFQEGEEGEEGGKGREGAWSIVPGAGTRFHSLPQMTAQLSTTDEQLQSMASHLKKIQETLDTLVEQSSRIQAHIFQDFSSLEALEVGHVVAFDPSREDHVTLASKENERLVAGVVTEPMDKDDQRCRVALYGRVRCKVVGRVEPGDSLVVASDVRGYAEKGGWYLRPGTILGKALSDKDEETGTVDMLVTLG